ncbi:GvpL/GvpF family gas vesicle protein [Gandjariella thermophila]|uniref:Gas vesicle protein n=1 Tax=Gandjariella thermophila TaxID=1931992 RepID=A0A4D4J798_9PSEU|nr:GvpL/GvpF family gas vesicle protein [Gandjariella thermophila]GDY32531.1 gas vesicle protein [Gandjariella thermophila]
MTGPANGTYLYGIVRSAQPLRLDGRGGVGDPPRALRRVPAGALAVVVSDAPERLRAKRRDLLAHAQVLEDLLAQGATLPMRFGSIAEDDDTVRRQVAAHADRYRTALSELDGRVEVNVKATHRGEPILREVLAGDDGLRRWNDDLRRRGGDPRERAGFGEAVARAVGLREAEDADRIVRRLRPKAVRESHGPRVGDCFVNVSFLVERRDLAAFEAAAGDLVDALDPVAEVRVRGPLPPYSFTGVDDT